MLADFDQHLRIYAKALHDKAQLITFKRPGELITGDKGIASEDSVYHQVEQHPFKLLKDVKGFRIYLIK